MTSYLPYAVGAGGAYLAYKYGPSRRYKYKRGGAYIKRTLPISNAKKIRRIQQGFGKELKTHDVRNDAVRSDTSSIFNLSAMAQGDQSIQREGLQIQPRHLRYQLILAHHASATNTYCRIIIFQDREQHGTAPTAIQLLETDVYDSFLEHDTRPRFRILRDMLMPMSNSGSSGTQVIKGFIKFSKSSKIWYEGTAAADSSMGKNQVYIYVVSNETTNTPTVNIQTRLRYIDS